MRVPILKDTPGFYSLEANGAVRHSHYSTSGGSTTYTINGLWKPVHDLLLRGAYSTGFRAPTLGELFGGRSRYDLPVTDPCTNEAGNPWQTNATARANCIFNGVPASGSYAEDPGQLPVITQGNRNLKPETSKSINFGAVFAHNFGGHSFSIEGDYHDIKIKNAISGARSQPDAPELRLGEGRLQPHHPHRQRLRQRDRRDAAEPRQHPHARRST